MVLPCNCGIFGCARMQHDVCSSSTRYGPKLSTDLCFLAPSSLNTYTVSLTLLKVDAVITPTPNSAREVLLDKEVAYTMNQFYSDHFHIGIRNVWLNWRMLGGCASQGKQSDIKTEINVTAVYPRILDSILTPLASPVKNVFFKDQVTALNPS